MSDPMQVHVICPIMRCWGLCCCLLCARHADWWKSYLFKLKRRGLLTVNYNDWITDCNLCPVRRLDMTQVHLNVSKWDAGLAICVTVAIVYLCYVKKIDWLTYQHAAETTGLESYNFLWCRWALRKKGFLGIESVKSYEKWQNLKFVLYA